VTGQVLDFNTAKRQGEHQRGIADADDIRARLHDDPRSFVDWLFSGRAYIARNQARIGNVAGEPGSSLAIDLGSGLWNDHATDQGGDLISLYRAWRGYQGTADFQLSLKEIARDYLNEPIEIERSSWKPTPVQQIEQQKAKLGTKPRDENLQLGAPVATYRYFDTHGNIIASVVRFEPDGTRASKTFRPWCYKTVDGQPKWSPGAPDLRPLYRLPEISISSTVVLCEGEGCADALNAVGIPATSAMQGAHAPLEKTDWSPLAGKTVIIWPDNDEPGFQYAKAVASRLVSLGCTVLGVTPPETAPSKWDAADCVAEGHDPQELIQKATRIEAAPKPRVQILSISDLASLPPPEWLINGIITVNGLSMVWGRSGSLKSFAALDMGLCIATGADWHGHAVKRGRVVYLAAEGARGLGSRALGWIKTRGANLPEPDFQIIPHALTFTNKADIEALLQALDYEKRPITLLVVDTLSRTFGNGNPNQPSDMNAFVEGCEQVRQATGAHEMIVHHGGKDTDKNELGNEGLRNAADTVIHVRRKTTGIELINEAPKGKQKDFDEFKTINLTAVKVHFEQNATEQSTLILNLDDQQPGSEEQPDTTEQRLGAVEKRIITALRKAGEPLGATRLALMANTAKGTVYTSCESLVRKNKIEKLRSKDDSHDEWRLV
jgi:hypothetical protein